MRFSQTNFYGFIRENSLAVTIVNSLKNITAIQKINKTTQLNEESLILQLFEDKNLQSLPLKFRILSPTEKYFSIDSTTRTIQNINPIDYETVKFYLKILTDLIFYFFCLFIVLKKSFLIVKFLHV